VELHLEQVDGQAVLSEVAATLAPLAADKGLQLTLDMPPGPAWLQTDRRALSQILMNLANNAIKFTETGEVRLTLTQTDGRTEFAVRDTGVGIGLDVRQRLFQAFEQVGGPGTRRQEGTGLGLYLSQKLAELLGGKIDLESSLGQGSTFRLSIPG
jgi:protein-histidine pros-kinase